MSIRVCRIESQYLAYLHQHDQRVSLDPSHTRPFIGILLEINGHNYYAPLSSPKAKHANMSDKALDSYKIDNGRLGIVNLNNMVPVPDPSIVAYDIASEPDLKYKRLVEDQVRSMNSDEHSIKRKAKAVYRTVTTGHCTPSLKSRCCDYVILENAAARYLGP